MIESAKKIELFQFRFYSSQKEQFRYIKPIILD